MAKRAKKNEVINGRQDHEQPDPSPEAASMAVPPEARAGLDKLAEDFDPARPHEFPVSQFIPLSEAVKTPKPLAPSIEDRLVKLESLLAESDKIIRQQSIAIAIGIDNAERLRKSRERVSRLEARMDEAKRLATEAKKSYEAAVTEHFDLEKDLDSPQARLPFPVEPEATVEAESKGLDSPAKGEIALATAAEGDRSWRPVPLDTLGISEELPHSIVSILGEAGLHTVGELADWTKDGHTLRDIPGIGPSKVERIEAALDAFWAFWARRPAKAEPTTGQDLLAGVEEIEAQRRVEAMPQDIEWPEVTGVENDDDDDSSDDDDAMSPDDEDSWRRDAGSV